MTLPVPEFGGLPQEDVFEFLKRFKLATLSLNQKFKCLALNKALTGPARLWAKGNLKGLINDEDWKSAKKAIVDRFAPPNRELRYQERLNKMEYDPKATTLMSYVEEYANIYRKAYEEAQDKDIVRALSLNLPKDILKNLNLISDNWNSSESLPSFFQLIRRLESKILPYEPNDNEEGEKISLSTLTKMLADIKDSLSSQLKNNKPDEEKANTSLALVTADNQDKRVRFSEPQRTYDNRYTRRYQPYRDFQPRPQERYYQRPAQRWSQNNERRLLPIEHQEEKDRTSDLTKSYYQTYGKPPNPCFTCGQNHFNRHCPFRELNLN